MTATSTGGEQMSLSSYRVMASIAVSDMARARAFYEGKLGLHSEREQADGSQIYGCGGGTSLHVFPAPASVGRATATLATWRVDDLERVIDALVANGVTFERYDQASLRADEKGIHLLGDGKVAWFKDPDGNTFAVEQ
jgi:catechol 2,3-dioxygenase-like lactoylglutathione lyase family enzyme